MSVKAAARTAVYSGSTCSLNLLVSAYSVGVVVGQQHPRNNDGGSSAWEEDCGMTSTKRTTAAFQRALCCILFSNTYQTYCMVQVLLLCGRTVAEDGVRVGIGSPETAVKKENSQRRLNIELIATESRRQDSEALKYRAMVIHKYQFRKNHASAK